MEEGDEVDLYKRIIKKPAETVWVPYLEERMDFWLEAQSGLLRFAA